MLKGLSDVQIGGDTIDCAMICHVRTTEFKLVQLVT